MAKRKHSKSSSVGSETKAEPKTAARRVPKWLIPAVIILALSVGGYFLLKQNPSKPASFKTGPVNGCQRVPQFVRSLGFGNAAAFSTSDRKIPGLILVEGERKYQHPSWKSAGSLAPITRNGTGDTFVGPAPWIDVLENKTEEQNRVYRVDGQTQEMKMFVDLPRIGDITSQNPYGILGMTFDCDTSSLYVSSAAGSTRDTVNGRIFQVDTAGKVVSTLDKTDAMGVGVFNTPKGKRLYFGLTRVSEIWSIALDPSGSFVSEPKKEISLDGLGPRGDDKARRINFTPQNEMIAFGIEFGFNLIAPTEKQETIYTFRYDTSKDVWNFVPQPPQIVSP